MVVGASEEDRIAGFDAIELITFKIDVRAHYIDHKLYLGRFRLKEFVLVNCTNFEGMDAVA
jgi:hypothetical protein